MTLGRQLFFAFIFIVTVVVVGVFTISVKNTHDYLGTQLESNAHDAAISLGISLSSIIDEDDPLLLERTVDSFFDSGYYSHIRVQSHNGKIDINKQAVTAIEGIPNWFIRLMPLDPPVMKAQIQGGWIEWGEVQVRSNSGYALEQLWNNFVNNLLFVLVVILLTIFVVFLLLKVMLTPLKLIEEQANAISNRDFPVIEDIPKTREFKHVVFAMNKMARKLLQMVTEQGKVADNLRREAYTDPLTGLGNRQSLLMRLDQLTKESDDTGQAAVAILKIQNMQLINREQSFRKGNAIFKQISELIADSVGDNIHVVKMNAVFGFLIQNFTETEVAEFAKNLIAKISTLRFGEVHHVEVHMGIAIYHDQQNSSDLLSCVDMALGKAEQFGVNSFQILSQNNAVEVKGGEGWRDEIKSIISDQRLELVYQPVKYFDAHEISQYEGLARFVDGNAQPVPAGIIFPMAERYQLAQYLDRIIIQKIFSDLDKDWSQQKILNVNLSIQSVSDLEFHQWLDQLVQNNQQQAKRLMIEISEQQYHGYSQQYITFINRFKPYGVRFSLDQFGINSTAIGFLQSLKIDQLKIDGSYVSNLHENRDNQFFLRALTEIAHSLDIKIVANFVEQEEELETVIKLGMDGAQGYHLGKPQKQSD